MICPSCGHDQSGIVSCNICKERLPDQDQVIISDEELEVARRSGQDIIININAAPQPEQKESVLGLIVWALIGAFVLFPLLVAVIILMIIF